MIGQVLKHPYKTLFLTLGIIVLIAVGFLAWVSHSLLDVPLCHGWHRNMTREEKIVLAVKVVNESYQARFEIKNPETGEKHFGTAKQIPYHDVETILKSQPECCKLYSWETVDKEHPSENVPQGDEGVVYVNYIGQYTNNSGEIFKAPVSEYANYNFCKN